MTWPVVDRLAGGDREARDPAGRWAVISFSIFIASTTQITWPSRTSSPSATSTASTVPCIGLTTASRAAAWCGAVAGCARAGGGQLGVRRLGPEQVTSKRRPSSSTPTTSSRTRAARGAAAVPAVRHALGDRLHEAEARLAGDEARVLEQRPVERDERRHALDHVLVERAQHAAAGALAVGVPDDELGDERVVEADDLRSPPSRRSRPGRPARPARGRR